MARINVVNSQDEIIVEMLPEFYDIFIHTHIQLHSPSFATGVSPQHQSGQL